jgi:hypothetical protein
MSANHYQILGVAPGADGAAIRAAYRALMRVYHPDRNGDPEAQSRAREITAAFAVLGDPEKRAAYDARTFGMPIGEQPWLAVQRRAPAPMRKVGMACIAVALALSVTLAVRPEWPPASEPRGLPAAAAKPPTAHVRPAAQRVAAPESVAAPAPNAEADTVAAPVQPPQPAPIALPAPSNVRDARTQPPPAPQVAQPQLREAPAPLPIPVEDVASSDTTPAAPTNARREQIERLATGFLKQSLDHADWKKQQLLLSARNRAATSLQICRSDDCVSDAYLRQIRDTSTIMEGRIPTP